MIDKDEKVLLIAFGMAIGNRAALKAIDFRGTQFEELVIALKEEKDRTFDDERRFSACKLTLDRFLASIDVDLHALPIDKQPVRHALAIYANRIALWMRSVAWFRREFKAPCFCRSKGEAIEKIKKAGYKDDRDSGATPRTD